MLPFPVLDFLYVSVTAPHGRLEPLSSLIKCKNPFCSSPLCKDLRQNIWQQDLDQSPCFSHLFPLWFWSYITFICEVWFMKAYAEINFVSLKSAVCFLLDFTVTSRGSYMYVWIKKGIRKIPMLRYIVKFLQRNRRHDQICFWMRNIMFWVTWLIQTSVVSGRIWKINMGKKNISFQTFSKKT